MHLSKLRTRCSSVRVNFCINFCIDRKHLFLVNCTSRSLMQLAKNIIRSDYKKTDNDNEILP